MSDFLAQEALRMHNALMHRHAAGRLSFLHGEIVSYNSTRKTAVVAIQPHGLQSGDLPVTAGWVGQGFGEDGGLSPGDQVLLFVLDDAGEHLVVGPRLYNDKDTNPGAPSGEYWLMHKSGSYFKLTNAGKVDVNANVAVRLAAPLIQLSTDLSALSSNNGIVRQSDLQALITYITGTLIPWLITHTHPGISVPPMQAGTLSNPSAATSSSVAQAK